MHNDQVPVGHHVVNLPVQIGICDAQPQGRGIKRRWAGSTAGGGGRLKYSEPMTKWEYVTVPLLVHATKQILDNWGQGGWELVQVVPGLNPENLVAYLKRPISPPGAAG